MNKEELAYTAGIIDGEGCIRLAKRGNTNGLVSYYIGVEVGMTNKDIIYWLKDKYGGSITIRNSHGNRKTRYDWSLRTKMAVDFLKMIYPYLRVKKYNADIALRFQSRRRHRGNCNNIKGRRIMTSEELANDEFDLNEMRKLNFRGITP